MALTWGQIVGLGVVLVVIGFAIESGLTAANVATGALRQESQDIDVMMRHLSLGDSLNTRGKVAALIARFGEAVQERDKFFKLSGDRLAEIIKLQDSSALVAGQTFCRRCYFALPQDMRKRLYRLVGDGYEQAYDGAVEFLQALGRIAIVCLALLSFVVIGQDKTLNLVPLRAFGNLFVEDANGSRIIASPDGTITYKGRALAGEEKKGIIYMSTARIDK